jgi:hypothetical protein
MHNRILSSWAFFHVAKLGAQASVALHRSTAAVGWMTKSNKTVTNPLLPFRQNAYWLLFLSPLNGEK